MPHIVLYIATSVDGYIATPDGGVDWLPAIDTGEADYGYDRFYAGIDALVMGRKTYEQVLTFGDWPYPGKPSYVMSRRQIETKIPEVIITASSPVELVSELQQNHYQHLWLVGGAATAAAFRAENLITAYILSIMPVLLGDGIPLFSRTELQNGLTLTASEVFRSGVVQLTYEVDRN